MRRLGLHQYGHEHTTNGTWINCPIDWGKRRLVGKEGLHAIEGFFRDADIAYSYILGNSPENSAEPTGRRTPVRRCEILEIPPC